MTKKFIKCKINTLCCVFLVTMLPLIIALMLTWPSRTNPPPPPRWYIMKQPRNHSSQFSSRWNVASKVLVRFSRHMSLEIMRINLDALSQVPTHNSFNSSSISWSKLNVFLKQWSGHITYYPEVNHLKVENVLLGLPKEKVTFPQTKSYQHNKSVAFILI